MSQEYGDGVHLGVYTWCKWDEDTATESVLAT